MKHVTLDFVIRTLRCFDGFNGPSCDSVWWRVDAPEYDPLTLIVNCNDLFFWACSDCERVTPENLPVLEQAVADCKAIDSKDYDQAHLLFCCRVRKMRPQKPYYRHIDEKFWPLFNACGDERDV